jgi:hypothetical protein
MVLTVVFGAIAGYEYWGMTDSAPASIITTRVTKTDTVTSFASSSPAEPRTFTNGTASIEFLGSSLVNMTTLSFAVKNVGNDPLSVAESDDNMEGSDNRTDVLVKAMKPRLKAIG